MFSPEKCIACRYCEAVCDHGGHSFSGDEHIFDRTNCIRCGECTQECYAQALELIGKEMEVKTVLTEVLKDRVFYQSSGGGLTISGGEPMQQFEFTFELLREAKLAGLNTCIETSGCSTQKRYAVIQPLVDMFYFDIKETDPELHKQYTGVSNTEIFENLLFLDEAGANLTLRCPIIPGFNDREDHFEKLANLANQLNNVEAIHVLPYHNLGTSKSMRLGETPKLINVSRPEPKMVETWVSLLRTKTAVPILSD